MRIDGLTGNTPAPAVDPKLKQAAQGFEQQLVSILVQQLQQTAQSDDDESGTGALGAYGSMLPDALSSSLEQSGGLGIADEITRAVQGR